jgi:hypothetical protein
LRASVRRACVRRATAPALARRASDGGYEDNIEEEAAIARRKTVLSQNRPRWRQRPFASNFDPNPESDGARIGELILTEKCARVWAYACCWAVARTYQA